MSNSQIERIYPIGTEILKDGRISFRVWAGSCTKAEVILLKKEGNDFKPVSRCELKQEAGGYFSAVLQGIPHDSLYKYKLDDSDYLFPDPASRFQPFGPHGPSQVIDPVKFKWTDQQWKGLDLPGQILYEMHVGTFTKEGSWNSAITRLHHLADLGITCIEMMPLADFSNNFGWGYDGVNLFAPTRLYGTPDNLKEFINKCHNLNIGVILHVVYNHLGPDGNYLAQFSRDYFTSRYINEWGDALNFDGPGSDPVREFFITNARYWINEFHFDGLRLDATQSIFDESENNIMAEIVDAARKAAGTKKIIVVGENEPQNVKLMKSKVEGGYGLDALWNDDFHHSAAVALTGHNEAYYTDYLGSPQEFISSLKWGFLYQGQWYSWQKNRRGTSSIGIKPEKFILYLQNHDQVANSGKGLRAHMQSNFGNYKALTALFLLAPGTPMFFQGQEFAASTPFLYFADHDKTLAEKVNEGRKKFLAQFRTLATPQMQEYLPPSSDPATFEKSKLKWKEKEEHNHIYSLHKDLLKLRSEIIGKNPPMIDGAVLNDHSFLIRYFLPEKNDYMLVINLGKDLHLDPAPEPLLAPPSERLWEMYWSTEELKYGGHYYPPVETNENWRFVGHSAILLKA
jgi:maltooligosyltrehalose trehalohydrolase